MTTVEIYVGPAECEHLAPPQARIHRCHDHRPKKRRRGRQKARLFIVRNSPASHGVFQFWTNHILSAATKG
jgi:hypothetical protein